MTKQRHINGLTGAVLAAAATLSTTPAAAQPATQSYERAQAERTMADFAACLIGHRERRRRAEQFLRLLPGDPAFQSTGAALSTPACVPRVIGGRAEMRFQGELLRASLFSALYQRDFSRAPAADFAAVPPLVIADEFDGPDANIPDSIVFTRTASDCVARANPSGVHALLMTRISSRQEQPALAAVTPTLAQCLPAGREMRFSRSMLRGFLAEAMYKLRRAAAAPAAATPRPATPQGSAQ